MMENKAVYRLDMQLFLFIITTGITSNFFFDLSFIYFHLFLFLLCINQSLYNNARRNQEPIRGYIRQRMGYKPTYYVHSYR